ncbi:glycosyltransferase family 2 protein [Paracoccus aestuariivivens]|uniref:Glycosyltransferase n=1 Tax=Paracoccus aestuariivivens TaxID=1820333 RepID=A0A6L6J7E7_9RHOB|nr:glycosyltransferase family 2 protein [Paracoccus aestuariivivens]MTH76557.1 glycosyltransferase [Paracoccus aestuariivivens]
MSVTSLSVVIPCHNEEGAIAGLITECFAALPERAIEVIIVDDGSQDATAARVLELAAHEPRLRLIRHARCSGQSATIRSGVTAARHDWVATLDGDGQNPPDQIQVLIAALAIAPAARVGMVQGQRQGRRDPASKRIASRLANALRNAALQDGVADSGCGLKLFRREAWLAMPFFDHIHRFTPAMIRRDGWEVLVTPVTHRARVAGRSNYSNLQRALVGAVDLLGAAWLIRRSGRPRPVLTESPTSEPLLLGRE